MEVQCSHCQQAITVTPEVAGQQVSCPHCGGQLVLPALGAAPPVMQQPQYQQQPPQYQQQPPMGAAPPSAAMQYQQQMAMQQQKKGGCMKVALWVGAAAAVLGVVLFFFWAQDNKLRKHGISQIEELGLSSDEELVYLAIAKHYHNNAANSGTRVTKKSTGTPSKADYWTELKKLIDQEIAAMPNPPQFEDITGNKYVWRQGMEHFVIEFKSDGTYKMTTHWDSDGPNYKKPNETTTGKWTADEDGFVWEPSGDSKQTQKILRMGREGFSLKVNDEEASFWKRRG